jgi:hypothetical protein
LSEDDPVQGEERRGEKRETNELSRDVGLTRNDVEATPRTIRNRSSVSYRTMTSDAIHRSLTASHTFRIAALLYFGFERV